MDSNNNTNPLTKSLNEIFVCVYIYITTIQLFSAPFHPIFIDIAAKFDSLFINDFADNAAFIGRLSQIIQAADMYYARVREINLQSNPQECTIYIPTVWAIHLQKHHFSGRKSSDSPQTFFSSAPADRQRLKLVTFCTNTQLMYFLRTIPAEIFTENVQQSYDSIDNFLADTSCFPKNYKTVNSKCYTKALNQIRLGMRVYFKDSGFGCYRNLPMIYAAQSN